MGGAIGFRPRSGIYLSNTQNLVIWLHLTAGRLRNLFGYAQEEKEELLVGTCSRIIMAVSLVGVETRRNPKTQRFTDRGMDK